MKRVAFILPHSTYRTGDFLAAAEKLGVEPVIVTDRTLAIAPTLKERHLRVDLRRPETAARRIVEHARRFPLDGIVAADDQGVVAAAAAAGALGLPANDPGAARLTRDKLALRRALTEAGLPQPAYAALHPGDDAGETGRRVGFPVVVKPLGLAASRGVIRADDEEEARRAATRVRAIAEEAGGDGRAPLVVERFLPGPEVALEGLLRRGALDVLALFDKPDPLNGPYFEETLYVTPSRLPEDLQDEIAGAVTRACDAAELTEGPVHAELRLTPAAAKARPTPVIVEVAARTIGGLCGRMLRFGLDMSLEELVIRHAAGLPLRTTTRQSAAAGVMMLPVPAAGVFEGVQGRKEALSVAGIEDLVMTTALGSQVRPLPESDRYLGFLFARARAPEEVEAALRKAHERLRIIIG